MGNSDKHPNNQDEQANSDNHIISIKTVAITYFGGLSIAMIITWGIGGFEPEVIRFAHWFPMGCLVFFGPDSFLRYGYVVYVVIFIYALILRQKPVFITLLVIYIVILCVNIRGCHLMINIDIH